MLRWRGMDPGTFARAILAGWRRIPRPTHVFVCVADHFEPDNQSASLALQRARVARWVDEYGDSVKGISDSRGRAPQHTFFFPVECYRAEFLDRLSELVRAGFGDVEVHLHHDNDSSERLREFLLQSIHLLHGRHGLLSKDAFGQLRYGFIHGNWALGNSHPDGRWCGVDDELTVLRETGCYADFTMPAAPFPTQTRTINSIYYALDDPHRVKPHDTGIPSTTGRQPPDDGLLMIQGPLLIRQPRPWSKPRVENGDVTGSHPPSVTRLWNWLRAAVSVVGHEQWLFLKLHTHGAKDSNTPVLLGPPMRQLHQALRDAAAQREFQYYYVTARELAQLVSQAERGLAVPDFDGLAWPGPEHA